MKKLLLTGAMLMAMCLTAKAQQTLTSFEENEADLEYTVGTDIADYDALWSALKVISTEDADPTTGDVPSGEIVISDNWASDGTQSLYFPARNVNSEDQNDVNYATTGLLDFSGLELPITIGLDTYTNEVSDNSANLNVEFYSYDADAETSYTLGQFIYDYTGTLYVANYETQGYEEAGDFDAEEVSNIKLRINDDGTVTYLVGGEEITTYMLDDAAYATGTYYLAIGSDDWSSDWYADNITIADATAGVKNNALAKALVYPNPASNVINVANAGALTNVKVADLNGRTVKTVNYNGATDAQLNISDLATGVYMVTIASDKGTTTKKVVKN